MLNITWGFRDGIIFEGAEILRMKNYIKYMDKEYQATPKDNIDFCIYHPLKVIIYGEENNHFLIRKNQFTKFLFTKDGCRMYFSDADILTMLLKTDSESVEMMISELVQLYHDINSKNCKESFELSFAGKVFGAVGINRIDHEQTLTNHYDIEISFQDLVVLINLILSKDVASEELWHGEMNFAKHTIAKYVSLLRFYYFKDAKAEAYLKDMGWEMDHSIYRNYDTQKKRTEKASWFKDFVKFEKMFLI